MPNVEYYRTRAQEKREFANKARQLATESRDPSIRQNYLDLAVDFERRAKALEAIERQLLAKEPASTGCPP